MPAASALRIEPGDARDKGSLEALQMRASLVWEEYRAALLAHPEAIEVPLAQLEDGRVLVAKGAGETKGFAALEIGTGGDADLDGLFVEPDWWGRQIGSQLIVAIEALALQRGCVRLLVVANPRAEGFYTRCGFRPIGATQTEFGPAVSMEKLLV